MVSSLRAKIAAKLFCIIGAKIGDDETPVRIPYGTPRGFGVMPQKLRFARE